MQNPSSMKWRAIVLIAPLAAACGGKAAQLGDDYPTAAGTGGKPAKGRTEVILEMAQYERVSELTVDDQRVYWASGSFESTRVESCTKNGCNRTRLTYPVNTGEKNVSRFIRALRVRDGVVYWLAQDSQDP